MPVTTDTIIIAQALASARSLARGIQRRTLRHEPLSPDLHDLARQIETDLDGALAALRRVEDDGSIADYSHMVPDPEDPEGERPLFLPGPKPRGLLGWRR